MRGMQLLSKAAHLIVLASAAPLSYICMGCTLVMYHLVHFALYKWIKYPRTWMVPLQAAWWCQWPRCRIFPAPAAQVDEVIRCSVRNGAYCVTASVPGGGADRKSVRGGEKRKEGEEWKDGTMGGGGVHLINSWLYEAAEAPRVTTEDRCVSSFPLPVASPEGEKRSRPG